MKRIDDMARWNEAALDTPFKPLSAPEHGHYPPGVCVKSRERDEDEIGQRAQWPAHFGRVVEFDTKKDYALVRSYGSCFDTSGSDPASAGTIWEGTISECLAMWEVD